VNLSPTVISMQPCLTPGGTQYSRHDRELCGVKRQVSGSEETGINVNNMQINIYSIIDESLQNNIQCTCNKSARQLRNDET
jgi:hypothetical protein